jgi:hypothetical protein
VLFEPAICAVHHESKTVRATFASAAIDEYWQHALEVMRARWRSSFITDPGFNPHYSRWARPFTAIAEPSVALIACNIMPTAGCCVYSFACVLN